MIAKLARSLVLAAVSLCLLPAAAQAAERSGRSDRIAAAVERAYGPLMQQYGVPGMAVAVTVDGRRYIYNFGVASRESRRPVTDETIFELGSISKTFTATLAAYAVGQGRLSLDDHPGRFMPALRGRPIDRASLLNLATYTAGGLPLQVPDAVTDDAQMTAWLQQWTPEAAPGVERRYSNISLGLFGRAAALGLGRDFADAETALFPRLGLRRAYIHVPAAAMADYAWGYGAANTPIRVHPGVFDIETYGVKTTAADLLAFAEANIRPEGLDPQMRRAVEATHVGYFRTGDMTQGLGWEQYAWPVTRDALVAGNSEALSLHASPVTPVEAPGAPSGPTLFNKTGSTNGFGAYVAFVPAKRIGIVMLANRNFPIPARVAAAYDVLQVLAAER